MISPLELLRACNEVYIRDSIVYVVVLVHSVGYCVCVVLCVVLCVQYCVCSTVYVVLCVVLCTAVQYVYADW